MMDLKQNKAKIATVACMALAAALAVSACGAKNEYMYLLECAEDEGFVASYRRYIAISENGVSEITRGRYNRLMHRDSGYQFIPKKFYSVNAVPVSVNPLEWEYTQGRYNDPDFDIDMLKNCLVQMNSGFVTESKDSGVYILITQFDNYCIIEATHLTSNHAVFESKYAVFRDGVMIPVQKNLDLSSIRKVYKYRG